MPKTLIVIAGATAIGKTTLAIDIAKYFNTEIISFDARQFYTEMNIGTAKPSHAELAAVKHHFINSQSIHDLYSAGTFEREALLCLDGLFTQHDIVVAVGGSGLYMKALCEGLDEMPAPNLDLRNELIKMFELNGIEALQNRLMQLDPNRMQRIDIRNPQRLMRAIELYHQTPLTVQPKKERLFNIVKIGLNMDRDLLYARINLRVDAMMQQGLLNEANELYRFHSLNALQTVGYTELFAHLTGKTSLADAVKLIKQHTRNYAKRQITWFKNDAQFIWFTPTQTDQIMEQIKGHLT